MFWILLSIALVAAVYLISKKSHKYWAHRGVPQKTPIPFLGDIWKLLFQKQSPAELVQHVYNMCPEARYSGIYQFLKPTLVLRDPELIKEITVKDFEHFADHRSNVTEDIDSLWARNLFVLKGQKWKEMRSKLSPTFTSSKMKQMFVLMVENARQFSGHFFGQNQELVTVEMKDIFTRFTNDVIANAVFGVKVDSLEDCDNEFYQMGREMSNLGGIKTALKVIAFLIAPKLSKIFNIRLFPEKIGTFFTTLVQNNVAERRKKGIVRPDMINLLMEAGEDDQAITAQAMLFFFAGFDSVSSLMSFMGYELGVNQDVQDKLRKEVDDVVEATGGKITYEAIVGMKYMDMVVSETLRKWPVTSGVDRQCTKSYTIEAKLPNEKPLLLKKKMVVWLPIFGLHRDPQYFPEPDRFDPERFSDGRRAEIKPYAYIPFGSGPRSCIGSRFALLETKVIFFHLLADFEIVPVPKTQIPVKISKKGAIMNAEGGFWFGLKRRLK